LKFKKAPSEGESWLEYQNRIVEFLKFLKEVEERYTGKNILIVSHGDFMVVGGLD